MILHGLSADRLEYTLSNGLGATKKLWSLDEIKEIYKDIEVQENEKGASEIGFKSLEKAEKFVHGMSELSAMYICSKTKFSMQFLADVVKKMSNRSLITIKDLYELSDKEVIKRIENCEYDNISKCFEIWKNAEKINESEEKIEDKYTVSVNPKIRYIIPLVKQENKFIRINQLSARASEDIERVLNYKTKKYAYLDFKF
ncbi:MAG: hypothetical protein HFJ51_01735 [Clostridia bacterium]|nr:hypothetical protein [Clostridia bacterium]